jgi:hypothetical protein
MRANNFDALFRTGLQVRSRTQSDAQHCPFLGAPQDPACHRAFRTSDHLKRPADARFRLLTAMRILSRYPIFAGISPPDFYAARLRQRCQRRRLGAEMIIMCQ